MRDPGLPGISFIRAGKPHEDERGAFLTIVRGGALQVPVGPLQIAVSTSHAAGTVRGLHWQEAPHGQAKLVACLRGALFDVVAEVDPGSPRFPSWIGFELRAGSGDAVYVPAGYAHGWQALDPGTELLYAVWGLWRPAAERGAKFDDSALSVQWPLPASLVSLRDRQWPDLPCPA